MPESCSFFFALNFKYNLLLVKVLIKKHTNRQFAACLSRSNVIWRKNFFVAYLLMISRENIMHMLYSRSRNDTEGKEVTKNQINRLYPVTVPSVLSTLIHFISGIFFLHISSNQHFNNSLISKVLLIWFDPLQNINFHIVYH